MHAKAANGDAEAAKFFRDLFPPSAACFLCDAEIGDTRSTGLLPDPKAPSNSMLIAPVCARCAMLPAPEWRQRVLQMVKAVWPKARWRVRRDADPTYLRRRR